MEGDLAGLDLAFLHINLVTTQDNGNVLTNTDKITMPVGDVLVGDTAGHVEHDDAALALDVVDVTETAKLFLAGSVPDVEDDGAAVGVEQEGTDLNTHGGNILFLKLTRQVALHKGGLTSTSITNKDELNEREMV